MTYFYSVSVLCHKKYVLANLYKDLGDLTNDSLNDIVKVKASICWKELSCKKFLTNN